MIRPPHARRRGLAGCAAVLLAVCLAAGALGRPPAPEPPAPEPSAPPSPQPPGLGEGPGQSEPPPPAPPEAVPAGARPVTHLAPLVPRRERGNLMFDNVPVADRALVARLSPYLESRQARLLDWLPDGSLLIATRFGETEQLHRLAAPMGAREQLTFHEEPVSVARAAPAGGGFVYLKDQGGNENSQLYYRGADGSVRELTRGDSLHGSPSWAHDGRRVAFFGNERDGASYDIYVVDVGSGAAPRLVVGGRQDAWYPLDWSLDDGKLLLWRYLSIGESYLYLADSASGALTPLDASGRKVGVRGAKFAPDGRGVYLLSDEDDEFVHLRFVDPVTHQTRRVTPADAGWDVEDFDVSADGRYIAYVVNQDGRSVLKLEDTQTHLQISPPGLPEGVISRPIFDRTGQRLALAVESSESPRDIYSYDLAQQRLERWTKSETGPVDARALIAPELIHYPTWDRVNGHPRLLSAYVYRPRNAAHCPVVIDIHGGPESQFRPGWDPFIQFLVAELGYAVVAPNVRGSSGYGKSFLALDNGELREDAVRDIGSLLVWIGAHRAFDRERISVMGASYGGYLTLASLIAYGERLRGGIDEAGISNFVAFLTHTAAYRGDLRRAEYGDERDPATRAFLERISPLTNAGRIKRPLLVVEGLNDPRVPASESEQLVWRVRAAGGEVWYLMAKDEGHGFRKKANQDAYLETAATFLQMLSR